MTSSVFFPPSTHLFSVNGPDARDFLHRMSTVNVNAMNPGDFRSGFLLNPQGKIRSVFQLACESEHSFFLEVDQGEEGAWKDSLLSMIDQFKFTEKFTLTEIKEFTNAWIFQIHLKENRFEEAANSAGKLFLFKSSGTPWTSVWGPKSALEKWITDSSAARIEFSEFERIRIRSLIPVVDREITPEANPLEIGMRDSIADQKGCYPGQEVIEKIVSLGSPSKHLALFQGSGILPHPPLNRGIDIQSEDGAVVGKLTSATRSEEGFLALGILRKTVNRLGIKLYLAIQPTRPELTLIKIAETK